MSNAAKEVCKAANKAQDYLALDMQVPRTKKLHQGPTGDSPYQPSDALDRGTAEGIQRIAQRVLYSAAAHALVGLGVANGRFNGLASFAPALFMGTERFAATYFCIASNSMRDDMKGLIVKSLRRSIGP